MEMKTSKIINSILSIVVLVLLVVTGQMTWQQFGEKGVDTISNAIDESEEPTTVSTDDELSIANNVQTFTSQDLGIRFRVSQQSDQGNGQITVRRWGNRVMVSPAALPANSGQSVFVFEKAASEDLLTAVKRQFLAGYAFEDCRAAVTDAPSTSSTIGSTFQIVQIQVPSRFRGDVEKMLLEAEKCPDVFTTTNGMAYFVADSKHPTQFAFFDIGQYPINAENEMMWQDTLEFLK